MYLRSIKGKRTFSYIHIYTFIYVRKGMGQIDERRLFDFNKIYKHFSFAFTYVLQLRRISRSVVRLDGSQGFLVKVSAFLSFFFFFISKCTYALVFLFPFFSNMCRRTMLFFPPSCIRVLVEVSRAFTRKRA